VFVVTESEWLKWWNEVRVSQMTSTTTRGPQRAQNTTMGQLTSERRVFTALHAMQTR